MCGAPVTDFEGNLIKPLSSEEFIEFTRSDFDLQDIVCHVYTDKELRRLAIVKP